MEISGTVGVSVEPNHLFRYPSEWDPRDNDKTKGGYLEGNVQLPQDKRNLKILISTVPTEDLESKLREIHPHVANIHPTLIHVIRKDTTTGRRQKEKEPVTNHHHFQQEFHLENDCLYIINKKSNVEAHDKNISDKDFMFKIQNDRTIPLGKEPHNLNIVIHIPKTDGRARGDDIRLTGLLENRVHSPNILKDVKFHFEKKRSSNLKKIRLQVDVFPLEGNENDLIGSYTSVDILDKGSKVVGAMEIRDVTPLVSCQEGGRKVIIVSQYEINKDVKPMFLLCDSKGNHLKTEQEYMVTQPGETTPDKDSVTLEIGHIERDVDEHKIYNGKSDITFITPRQDKQLLDSIQRNDWKMFLILKRGNDGYQSQSKYEFNYLTHGHFKLEDGQCFYCCGGLDDGRENKASLAPIQRPSGPGRKRRNMSSETSVVETTTPPHTNDIINVIIEEIGYTYASGTSDVPDETMGFQSNGEEVNVTRSQWGEEFLPQGPELQDPNGVQVLSPMSQLERDWMAPFFQSTDHEELGLHTPLEDILGDILFDGSQSINFLDEYDAPGKARHEEEDVNEVDQMLLRRAEVYHTNVGLCYRLVTLLFGDDEEVLNVFGLRGNITSLKEIIIFLIKELFYFPILLFFLLLLSSYLPTLLSSLKALICAIVISLLCRRFLV